MTDPRTHPVTDADGHQRAVAEYRQHGYEIVSESDTTTTLERSSRGSLVAHLALFFTVGFWTLGLANLWYARRKRKQTHDRVRVVTR